MPPGFDPVGGFFRHLYEMLRGVLSTPAGAPPNFTTVTVPLGSGYSREVEENAIRNKILSFAHEQLGQGYVFGIEHFPFGIDSEGWDCSELTEGCYRHGGLEYPDGSNFQRAFCRGRRVRQPKPADPFFFDPNPDGIGHTGLYVGNGMTIEARSHYTDGKQDGKVRLTPVTEVEHHRRFAGWFRHPSLAYPIEERA